MDRSRPTQELIDEALSGQIICNIGQVGAQAARQLDKLVKAGKLAKWRGHWYPHAGANWGIGPLKTCWGPVACLDHPWVSNPSPLNVRAA